MDPYLQGIPQGAKVLKQTRVSGNDADAGYVLPPIKKQSNSQANRNFDGKEANVKAYKPLNQPKMQKANSMGFNAIPEQQYNNENTDANKKQKQGQKENLVDYEKKNLERLQKIQEKKAQELAMMEEQRERAKEERERLRQIVSDLFMLLLSAFWLTSS